MPTGTGKTYLAIHAIFMLRKSTFITVPTIELMDQWYNLVEYPEKDFENNAHSTFHLFALCRKYSLLSKQTF